MKRAVFFLILLLTMNKDSMAQDINTQKIHDKCKQMSICRISDTQAVSLGSLSNQVKYSFVEVSRNILQIFELSTNGPSTQPNFINWFYVLTGEGGLKVHRSKYSNISFLWNFFISEIMSAENLVN